MTLELSNSMIADRLHEAEKRRSAARGASRPPEVQTSDISTVTVRPAFDGDLVDIGRLAQLDSGPMPTLPALVAEVDGELAAVLPLRGERPLADPFKSTAQLVRLLELRAAQLYGRGSRSRWRNGRRALRRRRAAGAEA
jgi:hypothetical protein